MTVKNFVGKTLERLQRFESYWDRKQLEHPAFYPKELPESLDHLWADFFCGFEVPVTRDEKVGIDAFRDHVELMLFHFDGEWRRGNAINPLHVPLNMSKNKFQSIFLGYEPGEMPWDKVVAAETSLVDLIYPSKYIDGVSFDLHHFVYKSRLKDQGKDLPIAEWWTLFSEHHLEPTFFEGREENKGVKELIWPYC